MARLGGDLEGPTEVRDAIADVSQAGAVWGRSRIKPGTVVSDAHGEGPAIMLQPHLDACHAARMLCGVLDRLRTGEVNGLLALLGAARGRPYEARADRRACRLRARRASVTPNAASSGG
jgi:hypothetical protein